MSPPRKGSRGRWRTAKDSDPNDLYELSVQEPSAEVDMIDRAWKRLGRRGVPTRLREDFGGSCAVGAAWVRRRAANTALCVDLCAKTLAWAKARHLAPMSAAQRRRISLRRGDVTKVGEGPFDAIVALNFSYFVLHTRKALVSYFQHLRANLQPRGIVLLDCYGGADSFREATDERPLDGYTYLWETERYDPITGRVRMAIHFRFPDGSELRRAFVYDWRLWTIPEIVEALAEAGFRGMTVYWEGTDHRTGGGNGIFRPARHGEACDGWIAYIAAGR